MGIVAPSRDAGLLPLPQMTGFPPRLLVFEGPITATEGTLPGAIAFAAGARIRAGPAKDARAVTPVAEAGAEAEGADVRAGSQGRPLGQAPDDRRTLTESWIGMWSMHWIASR